MTKNNTDQQNVVKLSESTANQINQFDQSIMYWSIEHTKAAIRVDEIKAQISALFKFKEDAVLKDLNDQGIDTKDCDIRTVDSSTVVVRSRPMKEISDAVAKGQETGS